MSELKLRTELTNANDQLAKAQNESRRLKDEIADLNDKIKKLQKGKNEAEAEARQTHDRLEDTQKELEKTKARLEETQKEAARLRDRLKDLKAEIPPPDSKPVPPVPDGVRGKVTAFDKDGGLVQLDIGLDAGLSPGATLDVYRMEGGAKYLGTVTLTDVRPKAAVGKFKPVSGKPLGQLKPDELPKVGDVVETQKAAGEKRPAGGLPVEKVPHDPAHSVRPTIIPREFLSEAFGIAG
jgi:hypothetical protein